MSENVAELLRFVGPEDLELLGRVQAASVTWRNAGPGTSYLLWSSETDYEIVTKQIAPLVSFGFAQCARDGHVELRPEGHAVLEATSDPVPSNEGGDRGE